MPLKARKLFVWILGIATGFSAFATILPEKPGAGTEGSLLVRGSFNIDNFTLMGDAGMDWELGSQHPQHFGGGFYWHLWRTLKAGFFYNRLMGVRHDEDWVESDTSAGSWDWDAASASRGENQFVYDLTPQAELSFLPGGTWTGDLKLRYLTEPLFGHASLVVRPGLSYFVFNDGIPGLRLNFTYEWLFPTNYTTHRFSPTASTLAGGMFYEWTESFEIGLSVQKKSRLWQNTAAFKTATSQSYSVSVDSLELGLSAHYRFEL